MKRQRADHGVARWVNAQFLLDDGESCAWIAKFLNLDDDTIRSWFKQYQNEGGEGAAYDGWEGGQSRMAAAGK
ncbi:helix-turn-helix domain-containing protein [Falsihalocynthiibacter sp. CO-5D18]|uniref:helix-turn-helix domain-containing protein n=1 Tax=Falsihalocynthiibacter sp. CO-5D18 TaxID=3240872 RepID=UPI0035106449